MEDDWFEIQEAQGVVESALGTMSSEILSSFDVVFREPSLSFSEYGFTVPEVPSIADFASSAVLDDGSFSPSRGYVWSSGSSAALAGELADALASGGIGLSQQLQDALFNRDRERRIASLDAALSSASAGLGARGFSMPNDYLKSTRSELLQNYQNDDAELSRKILAMMEEHARLNWQFCMQTGLSVEQFHAEFASRWDALVLQARLTAVDRYKAELQAEVEAYKAAIDGIVARLNAYRIRNEAAAVGMQAEVEQAKLEVAVATERAKTAVSSHSAEATRLAAAYKAYADLAAGYAGIATGSSLRVTTKRE